ncbi:MAG: cytochrome c oxidase subunit 3 [Kofleriaceae bacterium]
MSGDDHGHGHGDQSRFIKHHYDDAQHQFDSGKFGIWLFLAQEVLFFSALFVAYVLYRVHHPEIFSYAHKWLDVKMGAINTSVLIFSSLTAAWAVRAAQLKQPRLLIVCLATTIVCACAFLGVKYLEYSHKIHEHILFGRYFDPCVSPGGEELLTKNNECSGAKSTISWDPGTGKASEGCFDADKHDTDIKLFGIQADCQVFEQEPYKAPVLRGSATHDCTKTREVFASVEGSGGTYTFTGDCDTLIIKGDKNQVTIESVKHLTVDGAGNQVTVTKVDDAKASAVPADPKVKVDPKHPAPYVAASTITFAGPPVEGKYPPKLGPTAGEVKPDQGEKWRDKVEIKNQCPDELLMKLNAHQSESGASKEAEAAPKYPCWRPAYQPNVCPDQTTPEQHAHGAATKSQFGVLVEYNDKVERGDDVKIRAECKEAPAPKPLDAMATANKPAETDNQGIHPIHIASEHEEQEIESLGPPPEHTSMFLTIYFLMTGLHGLHVFVGILVFIWLLVRAVKGHFTPDYFGPVDFAALYWHIVDLIWIFLFPLLYLIH